MVVEKEVLNDEYFMREALKYARNAVGRTSPNPLVGAVIVKDSRIIAAGWHRKAGTEHAEIHALNMAGELAQGSTIYVTLEPCSHYGRTGPCAEALVKAGVKRVVVAMEDPNPVVAGKGLKILQNAGIEVTVGVLEAEARKLNEAFLKWITTGKPLVILKTAMSLDGKIATYSGKSQWISNEKSRLRVHELRDIYDGIMVGINTVLKDNPTLTTRLPDRVGKNPVRIVMDSRARTPLTSKLITDKSANTVIAVTGMAAQENIEALQKAGAKVIVCGLGPYVDIDNMLKQLGAMNITSLLVEGGGRVNFSLLSAKAVDKVHAFIAPIFIGGSRALTPVEGEGFENLTEALRLEDVEVENIDGDILLTGRIEVKE